VRPRETNALQHNTHILALIQTHTNTPPTLSQMEEIARRAASLVSRSPSIFLRVSTTLHSVKERTPAATISADSLSAAVIASSPLAKMRLSRHALMSSLPFMKVSFIAACINVTSSKLDVLGSALRPSVGVAECLCCKDTCAARGRKKDRGAQQSNMHLLKHTQTHRTNTGQTHKMRTSTKSLAPTEGVRTGQSSHRVNVDV